MNVSPLRRNGRGAIGKENQEKKSAWRLRGKRVGIGGRDRSISTGGGREKRLRGSR